MYWTTARLLLCCCQCTTTTTKLSSSFQQKVVGKHPTIYYQGRDMKGIIRQQLITEQDHPFSTGLGQDRKYSVMAWSTKRNYRRPDCRAALMHIAHTGTTKLVTNCHRKYGFFYEKCFFNESLLSQLWGMVELFPSRNVDLALLKLTLCQICWQEEGWKTFTSIISP